MDDAKAGERSKARCKGFVLLDGLWMDEWLKPVYFSLMFEKNQWIRKAGVCSLSRDRNTSLDKNSARSSEKN